MSLDAIRRAALPGSRTIRSTFLSVVLMAAVVLGLVAMHDSGGEHLPHDGASVATESAPHGGHLVHAAPSPTESVPTAAAVAVSTIIAECDSSCMADLLDCAAVAMACAMMIAFAVVLALAARPAMFARLRDAGRAVLAMVRDSVAAHLQPNLHVLSISRT